MTPYPQRKDARASSFVVCFEGKIQPAHKTGNSAPHRPAGLSLSHTPRPGSPPAGWGRPPGTAPPRRRLPPLGLAVCSERPKGTTRAKATAPAARPGGKLDAPGWARDTEPGDPFQPGRGTGSGPPPLGVSRASCSGQQNCGLLEGSWAAPSEPRPVRSSGLQWVGGCQHVGPPSLRPRASGGSW